MAFRIFRNIYLSIWLCWVIVGACELLVVARKVLAMAQGIYFSDQGSNPGLQHWVLVTGPSEKFWNWRFKKKKQTLSGLLIPMQAQGTLSPFLSLPFCLQNINFSREFSTCPINIRKFSAFPVNISHCHQSLISLHDQFCPHDCKEHALTKVTSDPFVCRSGYFVQVFTITFNDHVT